MYRAAEIRADGLLSSPRRQIKLSDAIIGATADVQGLTVVTRNPRDFGANKVRIPYQIDGTGNVINVLTPPA
jgi:predicted nucleic acid-binding protein